MNLLNEVDRPRVPGLKYIARDITAEYPDYDIISNNCQKFYLFETACPSCALPVTLKAMLYSLVDFFQGAGEPAGLPGTYPLSSRRHTRPQCPSDQASGSSQAGNSEYFTAIDVSIEFIQNVRDPLARMQNMVDGEGRIVQLDGHIGNLLKARENDLYNRLFTDTISGQLQQANSIHMLHREISHKLSPGDQTHFYYFLRYLRVEYLHWQIISLEFKAQAATIGDKSPLFRRLRRILYNRKLRKCAAMMDSTWVDGFLYDTGHFCSLASRESNEVLGEVLDRFTGMDIKEESSLKKELDVWKKGAMQKPENAAEKERVELKLQQMLALWLLERRLEECKEQLAALLPSIFIFMMQGVT